MHPIFFPFNKQNGTKAQIRLLSVSQTHTVRVKESTFPEDSSLHMDWVGAPRSLPLSPLWTAICLH